MLCCSCLLRCAAGKKGHAAPMRTMGIDWTTCCRQTGCGRSNRPPRGPGDSSSARSASWEPLGTVARSVCPTLSGSFCRVCIYRCVFATRQARIKRLPRRSTKANSDYIHISKCRHEIARGEKRRTAGSAGSGRCRLGSPSNSRFRACAAQSIFFPKACAKLISLKSSCQTFLADIKKSFVPATWRRIGFRAFAQLPGRATRAPRATTRCFSVPTVS